MTRAVVVLSRGVPSGLAGQCGCASRGRTESHKYFGHECSQQRGRHVVLSPALCQPRPGWPFCAGAGWGLGHLPVTPPPPREPLSLAVGCQGPQGSWVGRRGLAGLRTGRRLGLGKDGANQQHEGVSVSRGGAGGTRSPPGTARGAGQRGRTRVGCVPKILL